MRIDEMIKRLQEIKEEYGNLEVIGADDDDLDFVKPQKYIKMTNHYNDIIDRHTEDLDDDFLERWYVNNEKYSKQVVEKGICVKIF